MNDTPLRTFMGDSDQAVEVMEICNLWRQAFAMAEGSRPDATLAAIDPQRLSMAMTAAAIMAGTFFGNAIIAGLASDQDRRRAIDAFARNFRSGIDIGKRQSLRAIADMPVAGRA